MATKRLTERATKPFAGARVDRTAGTIDNVLICGTASQNGRDYPAAVLRRDYAVYEGAVVNCDHARESTVDRRFGWFTNVKPGDDGRPRGTLNVLIQHPMAARVFEAAERNPALFGFSHVAMCETTRGTNGREVVEAIKSVESIDLVASPATTKGLFESKGTGVKLTIKALCEALVKHPRTTVKQIAPLKALAEMDGMGGMDTAVDAPPADDADPEDGVTAAFKAAFDAIRDQLFGGEIDIKDALKKLKAIHTGHGDATGDEAADEAETGAADDASDDDDEAVPESKTPVAWDKVVSECKAAGLESPTAETVGVLLAVPTAAARAAVIKMAREAAAPKKEQPRSSGRAPCAGESGKTVRESKAVPTDGKAFAASVRD